MKLLSLALTLLLASCIAHRPSKFTVQDDVYCWRLHEDGVWRVSGLRGSCAHDTPFDDRTPEIRQHETKKDDVGVR